MEILTKKYGPLPGWAWLGIVGVGGYLLIKSGKLSGGGTTTPSSFDGADAQLAAPTLYSTPTTTRFPWWANLTSKQRQAIKKQAIKTGKAK